MAVYEVGEFIRDLRVERGYSQEELCFGICSTGNLSKIENSLRMPNRKTLEALLQRLGSVNMFLQFSSREEMYQVQLCKKIVQKLSDRNFEGVERSLEEFERTVSEEDILNNQYCRFTRAMINQEKGVASEEIIRELEEALRMTKPEYKKDDYIPEGLLTYNEILILINIANNYMERNNNKAMKILFSLKKYMDTHVLDEQEKSKKYQLIIFNLSNLLLEEKRYDEVIILCDSGIKTCKESNRLRLFPYFFLNKGFALLGKGDIEQAQIQLKKGYNVLDAIGDEKECKNLINFLKENWGFNI